MKEFIEKLIGRLEVNSFPLTFNFETESYLKYNKVNEIVNQLAEEYNNGWILCSERLPQEDEPKGALCKVVNVIMKNGTVTSGWCNRLLKKWYVLDYHSDYPIAHEYKDIIAWQPLPDEPYTDELDAKPCASTECAYQRNEPCPAAAGCAGYEEVEEQSKLEQISVSTKEKEIIEKMCECDMNVSLVAKVVYMHRNTVTYHMGKIKDKTGLDPMRFNDLVELRKMVEKLD